MIVIAIAACGRREERADAGADAGADASADASADAEASAEASADAGRRAADDADYLEGEARSARSIGHTSVVFKVELTSGKKAAWKPASRRGPLRYKGEIAARRLGIALGLPNVPRVFFRAFDAKAAASAALQGPAASAELYAKEVIVSGSVVKGALIPWIDGLAFLALESEPLASQWKRWLKQAESIPDEQRELARQISTLVAFDFVSGNWDRWSGGNVGIDKASGTLLYIDNDGAFFETPPLEGLTRNKRLLLGVERFSRAFVSALRALDDNGMRRAIGEEAPGVPVLSEKAMVGVLERRRQLLAIIDARLGDAGDESLFTFP